MPSISRLKSLEISGFKSFAKKETLSFTAPITSIVGPNGSGKSNVAESFRFVLGEQSIKSMRGKKGEDLIFNGGKDSARANRASVKVVFDNSSKMFNVDFDEVSIERVVHRDGVNEYFINGTLVRLKDVAELLAHANIGSSGHHIISQGEADRLLSAQPRERREMIEDALGLKVYQYRKDESEKKLEKTATHMKEVESLRREIAPHIKFLKKQVEKIEKAVTLRAELTSMYQEYFVREAAYLKSEKERLAEEKRTPSTEIHSIEKDLAHHKSVLDKAKAANGESSKTGGLLTLENEISEMRRKKDSCMRELGRLEGEISYLKRVIEKKIKEANEASTKQVYLREVESVTKEVEDKIGAALNSSDMQEVRRLLEEMREALTGFIHHHKHADGSSADDAIKTEEADMKRITGEMKDLEHKLAEYSSEEATQAKRYTAIKAEIDLEKDKNVESEKAILRIMSRQSELHGQLEAIKAKEERIRIEEDEYKRELYEAGMLIGRDAIDLEKFKMPHGEVAGEAGAAEAAGAGGATGAENRHAQTDRRRNIEKTKIRLEEMGGGGGEDIMKEHKEAEERDAFLMRELEDLLKSSDSLKNLIADLDDKLDQLFKDGIKKINKEFGNFFSLMFGGGSAELQVVVEERRKRKKLSISMLGGDDGAEAEMDAMSGGGASSDDEEDPEEGIDINVSLPHKRIKGLTMLSGGERALTSIALLFAMSQVNPPPFVILDETDAALDEANSRKYGDMIEALSKHSQLILITHNRETMSRAGVIYGVTMGNSGFSKLLSIAFEDAVIVAK